MFVQFCVTLAMFVDPWCVSQVMTNGITDTIVMFVQFCVTLAMFVDPWCVSQVMTNGITDTIVVIS